MRNKILSEISLKIAMKYEVLALCATSRGLVVLVHNLDNGEYVTWEVSPSGACYYGHYHLKGQISQAQQDFKERICIHF